MSTNKKKTGETLFSIALFTIPRHNLITKAAFQLLDAETKAKVEAILKKGKTDPNNWGGWADLIKDSTPPSDTETKKFLDDPRNESHKTWHYVNLPLGTTSYKEAEKDNFTRDDDVIQMYKACVKVLKDPKKEKRFSEVNALRLLGHLVGDIHQPLHIGCGFIDDSTKPPTIVVDPKKIKANEKVRNNHDTGGNKIMLPQSGNMHSFWDGSLSGPISDLNALAAASSHQELKLLVEIINGAEILLNDKKPSVKAGLSTANLEDLAQEWAKESVEISKKAYENIVMEKKVGKNYQVRFKNGKDQYIADFRDVIIKRMKLAASRLTEIVNALYK